jgi:hypothetical protein
LSEELKNTENTSASNASSSNKNDGLNKQCNGDLEKEEINGKLDEIRNPPENNEPLRMHLFYTFSNQCHLIKMDLYTMDFSFLLRHA